MEHTFTTIAIKAKAKKKSEGMLIFLSPDYVPPRQDDSTKVVLIKNVTYDIPPPLFSHHVKEKKHMFGRIAEAKFIDLNLLGKGSYL